MPSYETSRQGEKMILVALCHTLGIPEVVLLPAQQSCTTPSITEKSMSGMLKSHLQNDYQRSSYEKSSQCIDNNLLQKGVSSHSPGSW